MLTKMFVYFLIFQDRDANDGTFLDILKNQKYLGGLLLGIGFLLSLLGIMLFFEGNLLRIGNVCTFEINYLRNALFYSNS